MAYFTKSEARAAAARTRGLQKSAGKTSDRILRESVNAAVATDKQPAANNLISKFSEPVHSKRICQRRVIFRSHTSSVSPICVLKHAPNGLYVQAHFVRSKPVQRLWRRLRVAPCIDVADKLAPWVRSRIRSRGDGAGTPGSRLSQAGLRVFAGRRTCGSGVEAEL